MIVGFLESKSASRRFPEQSSSSSLLAKAHSEGDVQGLSAGKVKCCVNGCIFDSLKVARGSEENRSNWCSPSAQFVPAKIRRAGA